MTYSVRETILMSSESSPTADLRNQTEVFAVHGADPEILAFAMAKYSRSSLSMRESLTEISSQRAEQFLNTFYFQYGHRSIADLAHIAFAVERLSLLAAIVLVDEPRWDGQERSTRYQNFLKSGWYLPDFGADTASAELYSQTIESLFAAYQRVSAAVLDLLRSRIARPEALKPEAYERTLRARAFDVARYLLPLATNTSLGQIVSARTLETQVSRLLSHPAAEIRLLGAKLREAATTPAWDINAQAARAFIAKLTVLNDDSAPSLAAEAAALFTRDIRTAPTLVKYAQPNPYLTQSQAELAQAAAEVLANHPIDTAPLVDLIERTESLEVELAATLLYSASHHPYRQIRDLLTGLPASKVSQIIELGLKPPRPPRRNPPRLPRRRRPPLRSSSWTSAASATCTAIAAAPRSSRALRTSTATKLPAPATCRLPDVRHSGRGRRPRRLPLRHRIRPRRRRPHRRRRRAGSTRNRRSTCSRSAPASARSSKWTSPKPQYITELRSAPAGHFSYRRVAWEMFLALERQHPSLARHIRVTDFTQPIDIFQR